MKSKNYQYKWKHDETWRSANADIRTLNKWAEKELSTKKCIDEIAKNNGWEQKPSEIEFEAMMDELGWHRGTWINNKGEEIAL